MTNRLQDKVALIFGAGCIEDSWGNGNATAIAFAREGAKVVCVDINGSSAERTASLIKAEGGVAISVEADIVSHDDVRRATAAATSAYGRIDILHNNVGTNRPGGPVEMSEADWDFVMDVNAKGVFLTCKEVIPVMLRQGGGAIINVSSVASLTWTGHAYISYHASKAAVNQFTRMTAVQYAAQGIRSNAILPGLMDTPRINRHVSGYFGGDIEVMRRTRASAVPAKKMGSPWDIAWAAVFLASDEASYVTGLIMPVDGGLTCAGPHPTLAHVSGHAPA